MRKHMWGGGPRTYPDCSRAFGPDACGVRDIPTLEGYWVPVAQEKPLASVLEKHGMFTVYQFDDDGSFRVILQLPNSEPLVREGTYETKNKETLVNVPAEQVTIANDVTLSLAALANVAVEAEGDKIILGRFPQGIKKLPLFA